MRRLLPAIALATAGLLPFLLSPSSVSAQISIPDQYAADIDYWLNSPKHAAAYLAWQYSGPDSNSPWADSDKWSFYNGGDVCAKLKDLNNDNKYKNKIGVNIRSFASRSGQEMGDAVQYLKSSCGTSIIRVWGTPNYTGNDTGNITKIFQAIQGSGVDIKVIVALADFSGDIGIPNGGDPTSWYQSGYSTGSYGSGYTGSYLQYIQAVATAIAPYQSFLYTLELANEPHCNKPLSDPGGKTADMAACVSAYNAWARASADAIHSVSSTLPVSIGQKASENNTGGDSPNRSGVTDFYNSNNYSGLRFSSAHHYNSVESGINEGAYSQAGSLSQIFYIGEAGFDTSVSGPPPVGLTPQCIGQTVALYMNSVINGVKSQSLTHIKLLSPAFNMTSVNTPPIIKAMSLAGANFGSLDGIAGNAYNLQSGNIMKWVTDLYSDSNIGFFITDTRPLFLTEIGMYEYKQGGDRNLAMQNLADQIVALKNESKIKTALLFDSMTVDGTMNTKGINPDPEFEYNWMSDAEISTVCGGSCNKIGINFGTLAPQALGYNLRAKLLGMPFSLEIYNDDEGNISKSIKAALDQDLTPIIRIGFGNNSGNFDNPTNYVSFLKAVDQFIATNNYPPSTIVYAIAGPNEPDAEYWASSSCTGGPLPTPVPPARDPRDFPKTYCDKVAPRFPPDPTNPGDESLPEFHPLRPYPGTPCDPLIPKKQQPDPMVFTCGKSLNVEGTVKLSDDEVVAELTPFPNDPYTAKKDQLYRCPGSTTKVCVVKDFKFDTTLDLSQASFPIIGNTQDSFDDATKVNNYLSWYLNGTVQQSEQEPLDIGGRPEAADRLINFSGPIKKLLPLHIQEAFHKELVSNPALKTQYHNYQVGCKLGFLSLTYIESVWNAFFTAISNEIDFFKDVGRVIADAFNLATLIITNPPDAGKLAQTLDNIATTGIIDPDAARQALADAGFDINPGTLFYDLGELFHGATTFGHSAAVYINTLLGDIAVSCSTSNPDRIRLSDFRGADHLPPNPNDSKYENDFPLFWHDYLNWRGLASLPFIGGIDVFWLQNIWAQLFPNIPYSNLEDTVGEVNVSLITKAISSGEISKSDDESQPKGVFTPDDVPTPTPTSTYHMTLNVKSGSDSRLYFPHLREVNALSEILDSVSRPYKIGGPPLSPSKPGVVVQNIKEHQGLDENNKPNDQPPVQIETSLPFGLGDVIRNTEVQDVNNPTTPWDDRVAPPPLYGEPGSDVDQRCALTDAQSNPGDYLFGKQIKAKVSYTQLLEYQPAVTEHDNCTPNGSACGVGILSCCSKICTKYTTPYGSYSLCDSRDDIDVPTSARTAVFVKTPTIDLIYGRLVADTNSFLRRFLPKRVCTDPAFTASSYLCPLKSTLASAAFTGPNTQPACSVNHAGYPSKTTADILAIQDQWLPSIPTGPNTYVLIYLGVNDVYRGIPTVPNTIDNLRHIIDAVKTKNPSAIILARPAPTQDNDMSYLNSFINSSNFPDVTIVDAGHGPGGDFNPGAHTTDGLHPNNAGADVIAANFAPSLASAKNIFALGDSITSGSDPSATTERACSADETLNYLRQRGWTSPGKTSVGYSATSNDADNVTATAGDKSGGAEIFFAHLGSLSDYLLGVANSTGFNLQRLLRPFGFTSGGIYTPPSTPPGNYGSCTIPPDGPCSVTNMTPYFGAVAPQASQICYKESGGYPAVLNDYCLQGKPKYTQDYSVGLFQINLLVHPNSSWFYGTDPSLTPADIAASADLRGFLASKSVPVEPCYNGLSEPNGAGKPYCQVDKKNLVDACVEWFSDASHNIAYAKYLYEQSGWSPWAAAGPLYCNLLGGSPPPPPAVAYIARVSTQDAKSLVVTSNSTEIGSPTLTCNWASTHSLAASINANYFKADGTPVGIAGFNYNIADYGPGTEPATRTFIIRSDGFTSVVDSSSLSSPFTNIYLAVSGRELNYNTGPHHRTGLGFKYLTPDTKEIILFTVPNTTPDQFVAFTASLGLDDTNALQLDGGGSSTFCSGSSASFGNQRAVPVSIGLKNANITSQPFP